MKFLSPSTIRGIGLAMTKRALVFGSLLLTLFVCILLLQINEKYSFKPAVYLAVLVLAVGLFFTVLVIPTAIEKMKEDESLYLREAIVRALYSYALLASFVPVVGPFIAKVFESKKPKNPFVTKGD